MLICTQFRTYKFSRSKSQLEIHTQEAKILTFSNLLHCGILQKALKRQRNEKEILKEIQRQRYDNEINDGIRIIKCFTDAIQAAFNKSFAEDIDISEKSDFCMDDTLSIQMDFYRTIIITTHQK
ncbi:Hypothetical_protein [Hexamita inflata]|uniref:Hypothetical_protein n=1 Tax=Hexamita inflata TaxID=28002 RepID=A0AA86QZG2_9EUKA|nr:Hypothetical protein HINF_LOCUS50214 [Hexamita inflata]